LILIPGANSHVPIIGNGVSAKHELGHELGLGHAHTRIFNQSNQYQVVRYGHEKDPYDPMTTLPGVGSYNAPHLNFLSWLNKTEEIVYLTQFNRSYSVRIFTNGKGDRDFHSLKTLFYDVPLSNGTRKYWFTYVGSGNVAIHTEAPCCSGTVTYYEGFVKNGATHLRTGLVFNVLEFTKDRAKVFVDRDRNWVIDTRPIQMPKGVKRGIEDM